MEDLYPLAIWRSGPPEKVWPDTNLVTGALCHSMGGTFASALTILDDTTQVNGFFIKPSWPFSITRDGTVYQHYRLSQCPFHAGGHYWNDRLAGIEHEGGAPGNDSEPLTPAQLASSVALVRWIKAQAGWLTLSRTGTDKNLYEHNEVYSTACPSGRIPWAQYMAPQYNVNIADGFDVGLTRIRQLSTIREATREFRHAFGAPTDAHRAVTDAFTE